MTGRLIGIARKTAYRGAMEELESAVVTIAAGVAGDYRGAKYPQRQVTVLSLEDWVAALDALGTCDLPWTTRRANLLTAGVELPNAPQSMLQAGAVVIEVTGQTVPCIRMDEAWPGLRRALSPHWRGGITCRVLEGGALRLGDRVEVLFRASPRQARLPG